MRGVARDEHMTSMLNHVLLYLELAFPGAILATFGWIGSGRIRNRSSRTSVRAALVGFVLAPTKAVAAEAVIAPASWEFVSLVGDWFRTGSGFLKEGGLGALGLAVLAIAISSFVSVAAIKLSSGFAGRVPNDL